MPLTPPAYAACRLLATDLDGTLLRGDATVSARTRAALDRARNSGMAHVIVTGRPAAGCLGFFDALGYRGLAVCGQGAQIYDTDSGLLLSHVELDRDLARKEVARIVRRTGPLALAVVTSGAGSEFVVTPGYARGDQPELSPFRLAHPDRLWDAPVDKVLMRHDRLTEADLVAAAAEVCGPAVTVTHSGPGMVELLPTGFDKATGLAEVARRLGFAAYEVIAFGDMPNDLPMLGWAGYAVATGNCHPEVKAVADEIAPANDDDGVAVVVERILAGRAA